MKLFRLTTMISGLALVLFGLAACSAPVTSAADVPTRIEVVATEMKFEPSQVMAKVEQPITVAYVNEGVVEHDWAVLELPAYDVDMHMAEASHAEGSDSHDEGSDSHDEGSHTHSDAVPDVHITAMPGQRGELVFTPDEPGRYTIVCTIPGHKESGMMGMLTVVE